MQTESFLGTLLSSEPLFSLPMGYDLSTTEQWHLSPNSIIIKSLGSLLENSVQEFLYFLTVVKILWATKLYSFVLLLASERIEERKKKKQLFIFWLVKETLRTSMLTMFDKAYMEDGNKN